MEGENLINVFGSSKPIERTKKTLLESVDYWISKRFKILKNLHLDKLGPSKTIRMLLGDEIDGVNDINIAAMGEGISQVLPIIATTLLSDDNDCLVIEQPEIHLHPGLQADLADLFIEVAPTERRQIILETHSEHILLRIRRRIAEGVLDPEKVAILFVEKEGLESKVRQLNLNGKGHFDEWPKGFFEDAYQEAMALAMAKKKKGLAQVLDLVIDTVVIMIATEMSDQEHQPCLQCHRDLLNFVRDISTVYLAIDEEGLVNQEYTENMSHGSEGQEWLRLVATRGKIISYPRGTINKSVNVKLQELHFHKKDKQFVRAALATKCRILVTENMKDYSEPVCRLLKKELRVFVHQTDPICQEISANHSAEPPV